jgi:glutaredoxin
VCQNAEALLNRRGVPFTTVNVEDVKGAEQLKKLTGEQQAPVLQLGDKLVAKGFNESRWQAMLDEAGYPNPRRAGRRRPRARRSHRRHRLLRPPLRSCPFPRRLPQELVYELAPPPFLSSESRPSS